MMTLRVAPRLMMDCNAKEAIQFYEKILDAKVQSITTYRNIPDFPGKSFSEKILDRVAYGNLVIGQTELMIFDSPGFSRQ